MSDLILHSAGPGPGPERKPGFEGSADSEPDPTRGSTPDSTRRHAHDRPGTSQSGRGVSDATQLISVVIPALNDAPALGALLPRLRELGRDRIEVIVVDGGSSDDSCQVAAVHTDSVLTAPRGRARQLQAGFEQATGDVIWMLHADSGIEAGHVKVLEAALADGRPRWGRFDVRLDAPGWLFRATEFGMNRRSCWSGICTGDQGIFVRRELLDAVGGVPQLALMEDVELSKRLRRLARPVCARCRLVTSARRWQQRGVVRTILLMWRLRLQYFFGADPERLVRSYYGRNA